MADTYASIRNKFILALVVADSDQAAQDWFRELPYRNRDRAKLVVLDLARNETPELGMRVEVDDCGVATIATQLEGVA